MKLSSLCQWLRTALVLVAMVLPASVQAQQAPEPTIPNFWDPRTRVQRPLGEAIDAIRFVTADNYPPFNFLDSGGRLTGFNIDLARAVCRELSLACTIQARPWEDIVPAVLEGRADAAIAGLAITAQSRARLDFTGIYLRPAARFVVRRDAKALTVSPSGLAGKRIAVAAGSAHEAYLAAFFPEATARSHQSVQEALAALAKGEADAYFGDGVQLSFWLQSPASDDCCAFAGGPYLESRFFGQGLAIAVAPDSGTLRQALDAALEAVHADGTYAELYLRYFPIGYF